LAISAFAIYQKFTGWLIPNEFWAAEATRRVTSFFGYPNAIGLYLGPIIILYVGQLLNRLKFLNDKTPPSVIPAKAMPTGRQAGIQPTRNNLSIIVDSRFRGNDNWLVIFNCLVIIASLLSVIFAVSEGALIGIFTGLIFLGLFFNCRSRAITLAGLITLAIFIWLTPNFSQPLWQELTFQGTSGKIRTEMWSETWLMLKDHFAFGAGLAGYQQTFDPYHQARHIEVYLYPHNIFLNFWSELGLAGLLLFGYLFYNFFRQSWRLLKNEKVWALTLMAIMVTIIIHGLVDAPYFKNDLAVMFWLWLGMMEVLKK